MKAKLIEYAYPSSTTATNAGYGNTGCWFVRLYPSVDAHFTNEKPVKFFPNTDKDAAIQYADNMPNPYNCMHQYFNR